MKDTPAFPMGPSQAGGEYFSGYDGMTLRDYFAAKAMQAEVQSCDVYLSHDAINIIVARSYRVADAMLKAREEQ